jgi:hypothetical protein
MRRTDAVGGFVTRFQEAFEQYEKHRLSSGGRELLGMSGRMAALRSLRGGWNREAARSAARQGIAAPCAAA